MRLVECRICFCTGRRNWRRAKISEFEGEGLEIEWRLIADCFGFQRLETSEVDVAEVLPEWRWCRKGCDGKSLIGLVCHIITDAHGPCAVVSEHQIMLIETTLVAIVLASMCIEVVSQSR